MDSFDSEEEPDSHNSSEIINGGLTLATEFWTRLALAVRIHAEYAVRSCLENKKFKLTNPLNLHLRIATARGSFQGVSKYIWKKLLGVCQKGCQENPCKGKTYLEQLDITILDKIVGNIELLVPADILQSEKVLKLIQTLKIAVSVIIDIRNKLFHDEDMLTIEQNEFQKEWQKLKSPLKQLNYANIKDFETLENCSLDPHIKKQVELLKQIQNKGCLLLKYRVKTKDSPENKDTDIDMDLDGELVCGLRNSLKEVITENADVVESDIAINFAWDDKEHSTNQYLSCEISSSNDQDFEIFRVQESSKSTKVRKELKEAANKAIQEFCTFKEHPIVSIVIFKVKCLHVAFYFLQKNKPWGKSHDKNFLKLLEKKIKSLFEEEVTVNFVDKDELIKHKTHLVVAINMSISMEFRDLITVFYQELDSIQMGNTCKLSFYSLLY